jgi:hypothetical protein
MQRCFLMATTLVALVLAQSAAASTQNLLMWAEWPSIAATGKYLDMACYYKRLANVIIASHAPGSTIRYDRLVLRVEDPLTGSGSATVMNNWIFDPEQANGKSGTGALNPFAAMLSSLRSTLGSGLSIYVLPSFHVGDYYRWPCYPPTMEACASAVANTFIFDDEVIACGPVPVPPAPSCGVGLRPNGCACAHSWNCVSNWCVKGQCAPQSDWRSSSRRRMSSGGVAGGRAGKCVISSAVRGDPYPFAYCCGSVKTATGNVTIDLGATACCDGAVNATLCNAEEVAAKGGPFPCVNPLNRFAFWMRRWEDALSADGGVVFFDGVTYDLESTGFDEATLYVSPTRRARLTPAGRAARCAVARH